MQNNFKKININNFLRHTFNEELQIFLLEEQNQYIQ